MGTVHSLFDKDDALGILLRAAVSAPPLPKKPAMRSKDRTPRQGTDADIRLLREANSRLRAVAIELSNLVGDLPTPR
jgi:hypothetical protein